jgi:hypothetical protein
MEPKKPNENMIRRRGENSRVLLLIGIGVCILASSLWFNQRDERIKASNQFGGQGNGFAGRGIEDPYRAPRRGEYQERLQLPIAITIQIPEETSFVQLIFLYRLLSEVGEVWLEIPTIADRMPLKLLIHSTSLMNNPKISVSNGQMTLIQKEITYPSVEAFIREKGYRFGTVLSETSLVWLWPEMGSFVAGELNESNTRISDADYVLTSWLRPRIFPDNWLEFYRKIDLSGAIRNEDGSVTVMLTGSGGAKMIEMTKPQVEYGRE